MSSVVCQVSVVGCWAPGIKVRVWFRVRVQVQQVQDLTHMYFYIEKFKTVRPDLSNRGNALTEWRLQHKLVAKKNSRYKMIDTNT